MKKSEKIPPSTPMNQWVQDMVDATGLSGPAAAEILMKSLGGGYNRFTLYKMTRKRKVTLPEAQALSAATGFPLPQPRGETEEQTGLRFDLLRKVEKLIEEADEDLLLLASDQLDLLLKRSAPRGEPR